jgi:hypothetical protein
MDRRNLLPTRWVQPMGRWLARRWGLPVADPSVYFLAGIGLVGAAASLLLLGQIARPHHPEMTLGYKIAVVVLGIGAISIIWGGVEGFRQGREMRLAPLRIEHDTDDPQCVQVRAQQGDWELRIRVRNMGRFSLNHVRARLDLEGGYSHWLRLQHDNAAPYHRSIVEGEVLPSDDAYALYFDVGFMNEYGQVWPEFADDYLRESSMSGEIVAHAVTIRVWATRERDGCTVRAAEHRFVLESYDPPEFSDSASFSRRLRLVPA